MENMTVKNIIEATGGVLLCGDENTVVTDVWINSKEVKPGDLFVPIQGKNVDGHKFIEDALKTAAATLTSRHTECVISDKPYIYVSDTFKALQSIGKYVRDRYKKPVIAVTGSVGKTTTRQMITAALDTVLDVYHTEGNLNSQIGVPITLSRMTEKSDIAVLELGISEEGHMDVLSELVRPDIAVVTTIGVAHIEFLKTKENIRKEKLKIASRMDENGVLFLNGDDELLAEMKGRTGVKTFFYGTSDWCDFRAENIREEENFMTSYDYVHGDNRIRVYLNSVGMHNVENSLAGMAITEYLGLDINKAAEGYKTFNGMRQRIIRVADKYTIIDDTYNASPDSVKASIDVLCGMECKGSRVAVLGDMFELGENSEKYHYDIGLYLADKDIKELIVLGELTSEMERAVKEHGKDIKSYRFKDNEEAAIYLMATLKKDDIVLIKGSNGMHLNEIVNIMTRGENANSY